MLADAPAAVDVAVAAKTGVVAGTGCRLPCRRAGAQRRLRAPPLGTPPRAPLRRRRRCLRARGARARPPRRCAPRGPSPAGGAANRPALATHRAGGAARTAPAAPTAAPRRTP
eukprot:281817-Chlamydomonas_euryale.AAC.9